MKNLSFTGDLNRDYEWLTEFSNNLQSTRSFIKDSKNIRKFHYSLFTLKDLIQQLQNNSVYDEHGLLQNFSILISSLSYVLRGDNFAAMAVARPAMELLPKTLLQARDEVPSNNFSNNLEKCMSLIKKHYIRTLEINRANAKENFNPIINEFTTHSQELYWHISDYTHVSNEELLTERDLLESFLIDNPIPQESIYKSDIVLNTLVAVANFCKELLILDSLALVSGAINPELIRLYTKNPTRQYANIKSYISEKM